MYVYIAKSEEKHPEYHFKSGVCYHKGFLKKPSLTELIFYLKVGSDHFKGIQDRAMNFLSPNVGFLYFEGQLRYIQ